MHPKPKNNLKRALGLTALIIYGVGDILGAGIYAIIGKIAGHAGSYTWLSFAIALIILFFTALSYSELCSRFPKSGSISVFVQEAFSNKLLSTFSGLLLFSATIFSMSTLSKAFVGYLETFGLNISDWIGVSGFLTVLLLINIRGIKQSSFTNIVSTMVEVSGLIIVLICGIWFLSKSNSQPPVLSNTQIPNFTDILQGTALAFFAFTGFEDLANISEEVKQPEKNLPRAILFSLGIAGILYLCVSWVATAVIPSTELSQSQAPLLDVVHRSYPQMPVYIFSIIAIFAISNTALLNSITASRLLYGMSKTKLLPNFLQTVHYKYRTPYIAILAIFPLVFGLGILGGTLKTLASSTSVIVLTVFTFSNIALITVKLKTRKQTINPNIFTVPFFVPIVAILLNLSAIFFLPFYNILSAVGCMSIALIFSWLIAIFKKY